MGKVAKDLSVEQKIAIVSRWQSGDACTVLADEYGCSLQVVRRIVKKAGMRRRSEEPVQPDTAIQSTDYKNFKAEAERVLRAQYHDGRPRNAYQTWRDYIQSLMNDKFSGPTATVQASKGFDVLRPLFLKYDIEEHDPLPDSHVGIAHKSSLKKQGPAALAVYSEDRDLSYRENIRWAATAAGHNLRTKKHPRSTPNDFAWFLYNMALDEPRDFMAKVASLESKFNDDSGDEQGMRREVSRTVKQLDNMLEEICDD